MDRRVATRRSSRPGGDDRPACSYSVRQGTYSAISPWATQATASSSSASATRASPSTTSHAVYDMARPVCGWIRSPSSATACTVRPVSSPVSRTAASSADSPGSIAPAGNCHISSPSGMRRRTISTRPSYTMIAALMPGLSVVVSVM